MLAANKFHSASALDYTIPPNFLLAKVNAATGDSNNLLSPFSSFKVSPLAPFGSSM